MAKSDADLMNELYNGMRHKESIKGLGGVAKKESGGQLDSVSDMMPTPNPMDVIQPMDITQTIQPMAEGGEMSDLETQKIAILFLDIKSSSKMWTKDEDAMFASLTILDEMMGSIIADNNGMIVKTIGDAFMCSFDGADALFNAVKSAFAVQDRLINRPIMVGNDRLTARLGVW